MPEEKRRIGEEAVPSDKDEIRVIKTNDTYEIVQTGNNANFLFVYFLVRLQLALDDSKSNGDVELLGGGVT